MRWPVPPSSPRLGPDEIHIWSAALDPPETSVVPLAATLSSDERIRAARFVFPIHRRHFTVGRGFQRAVLGRYLQLQPAQLRFRYGQWGKPALTASQGGDLTFNLSNSGGIALLAVARRRRLGVDVELIRPLTDLASIAESYFSAAENAVLANLPAEQQADAFFNCWTRKEAYIKAVGGGLSLPLDAFDVSLTPGAPAALLATRPDPAEARRWSLRALDPAAGYAAALIFDGPPARLSSWRWSPPDPR